MGNSTPWEKTDQGVKKEAGDEESRGQSVGPEKGDFIALPEADDRVSFGHGSSTRVPPVEGHGRDGHATIHGYKRTGADLQVRRKRNGGDERGGARTINVRWDFDYGKRRIACKVQDDMGGEGLWTTEIEVE